MSMGVRKSPLKSKLRVIMQNFILTNSPTFVKVTLNGYLTSKEASRQANDPSHLLRLWLCPLPSYLAAVAGRRLTESDKRQHEKAHRRADDIPTDFKYIPQEVGELRIHSATSFYLSILRHNGLDPTNGIKNLPSLEVVFDEDDS